MIDVQMPQILFGRLHTRNARQWRTKRLVRWLNNFCGHILGEISTKPRKFWSMYIVVHGYDDDCRVLPF